MTADLRDPLEVHRLTHRRTEGADASRPLALEVELRCLVGGRKQRAGEAGRDVLKDGSRLRHRHASGAVDESDHSD